MPFLTFYDKLVLFVAMIFTEILYSKILILINLMFINTSIPEPIAPAAHLPMVLQTLRQQTNISVSRDSKRLSWGIPVPDDPTQTVGCTPGFK